MLYYNTQINKIDYDDDEDEILLQRNDVIDILNKFGVNNQNNYLGKISIFKGGKIPLKQLENKFELLDIIDNHYGDRTGDWIKRLIYLLSVITKPYSYSYFDIYNEKFYNPQKKTKQTKGFNPEFITSNDLSTLITKLKQEYSNTQKINTLENIILFSLYRNLPLRLDYNGKINPKHPLTTENYYDTSDSVYYLNVYKTLNKYGKQVIPIPENINKNLIELYNSRKKQKIKNVSLLMSKSGTISYTQYSKRLSNYLGTNPIKRMRMGSYFDIYSRYNFKISNELDEEIKLHQSKLLHSENISKLHYINKTIFMSEYNKLENTPEKKEQTKDLQIEIYSKSFNVDFMSNDFVKHCYKKGEQELLDHPNIDEPYELYVNVLNKDKVYTFYRHSYLNINRGDKTKILIIQNGKVIDTIPYFYGERGLNNKVIEYIYDNIIKSFNSSPDDEIKSEIKIDTTEIDTTEIEQLQEQNKELQEQLNQLQKQFNILTQNKVKKKGKVFCSICDREYSNIYQHRQSKKHIQKVQ